MNIFINNIDVTNFISDVSLSGSYDSLGLSLDLTATNNKNLYTTAPSIKVGDKVKLFEENEQIFFGVVISINPNKDTKTISCFDYGFYLNKSTAIIYFNNVSADTAIKQLLEKYKVPIGNIPSMSTRISKVYYDVKINEIIKEIIELVKLTEKINYYLDFSNGKFNIITDIFINPVIKLAENVAGVSINGYLSDVSATESIENMINHVIAYSGDDDGVTKLLEVSDNSNIEKYGLLSKTSKIEDEDISKARFIIEAELLELNIVEKSYKFTSIGDFSVLPNRTLPISDSILNIFGNYRVTSVTHTVSAGFHTMSVEVHLNE